MDKKTQGAWLLHHARKLQATTNQDFDSIAFAGKSGTLLSAISAERQSVVTQQRLEALARANHISPKTEHRLRNHKFFAVLVTNTGNHSQTP